MGNPPEPGRFYLVLVPHEQVTTDGCRPGTVKLTGTPGAGSWDEWGPYRAGGEFTGPQALAVGQLLDAFAAAPGPQQH